jgi:tripartite-type tricarboxylate transporter receptor subunit TctC
LASPPAGAPTSWGVSIIADNRPASGGVLAMDMLAAAPPDGYTWLASGSQLELAQVFRRVNFDVMKSYEPMVQMTSQPYLLMVTNALPAKSVKELIALAKSKPGELNYATAGLGSAGHIGHENFNALAGVKMAHIPYKGAGAAAIDLAGGRVQLSFITTLGASPLLKAGTARALAVTAPKRLDALPDIPTMAEAGLGDFEMNNNYGLFTVAGTPAVIIAAINKDVTQVLFAPDMKARLEADGAAAVPSHTPAQYRVQVEKRIARFTDVVKASGITPDS